MGLARVVVAIIVCWFELVSLGRLLRCGAMFDALEVNRQDDGCSGTTAGSVSIACGNRVCVSLHID